ncbi:chorismate mutase family protein [Bartonella bilalgolemii]|uniref:Chorismate mutase n=1 Tax=Bartonella bilalgolemii TaxID=2942911 RepID=A0ABT0P6Y0_9HYPH|nr:chorismate mutase [Bartonella sp. G70]MCL6229121.1 chorismate mutase [Bartonella sp. G70]
MQGKAPNNLGHLRAYIGNFNAALINFLAQRFCCTQGVRGDKVRYGLPTVDRTREQCQVVHLQQLMLDSHLTRNLAEKFIVHYSRSELMSTK